MDLIAIGQWFGAQLESNPLIAFLVLSVLLNMILIKEVRALYTKLIERATQDNDRLQEQMAKTLGTDSRLLDEATKVLTTFQQWQKTLKSDDK